MSFVAKSKKITVVVMIIVGMVGTILGIIVDAPQAISKLSEYFPDWVRNPDLWWVVIIAIISGLLVWWVWSRPSEDVGHIGRRVADKAQRVKYTRSLLERRIKSIPQGKYEALLWILETGALLEGLFGEKASKEFYALFPDLSRSNNTHITVSLRLARGYLESRLARLHEGEIRTV